MLNAALVSASVTLVSPLITAASLLPVIVTVTTRSVPSADFTVNVSVSVPPTLSALTAALPLLSV